MEKQIPLLSFFTGGGFLDIGFEEAGFEVVWTNEFDRTFADMYEHGMTSWRWSRDPILPVAKIHDRRDITTIQMEEILSKAFTGRRPDVFGVIGGPPCPDFSIGGRNSGHRGERGKLSQTFIDLICSLRPQFFVMENVPGLFRTRKHRQFFEKLRLDLWNGNYATSYKMLNALHFGVPQDRLRLFVVGFSQPFLQKRLKRHVMFNESWFPFPCGAYDNAMKYHWPTSNPYQSRIRRPKGIPEELTVDYWFKKLPEPYKLPNGKDVFAANSEKFRRIPEGDNSGKSFKRLHRYRYSPTVCYGNNEVHLHPTKPRRLSVREAMRLQTIPDEYVLPMDKSLTAKFKLVGNGVPCILAEEVAKAVMSFLNSTIRSRKQSQ